MAGRTRRPTRATRVAWRLAVLGAAAAGIWALADTLAAEPARADELLPVVDATIAELVDEVDVVPVEAADTAAAVIADAEVLIESISAPAPTSILYANSGPEGPDEPPVAAVKPVPRPEPTPAPAKRLPAPRTATAAQTSETTQHRQRTPATVRVAKTDPRPAAVTPLRSFPDCGPNTATAGGTATAIVSPASPSADLTGGWAPPDLMSVHTHPSDVRACGLSWRPGEPPG
jgi:outer membrane biosynthesis protein TonB